LGAIGREIKQAKPHIPVQFHDPLTDVYTAARERIREANPHQMMDEEFRNVVGRPSPNGVAGRPEAAIA